MEEIKVGEYVTTKKGYIYKIENIIDSRKCKNSYLVRANGDNFNFYINKETIKKHSFNIIDLIEVGDYVNGKRVDFDKFEHKLYVGNDYDNQTFIKDMDIKTILTKEMYTANCYGVK